MTLMMNDGWLEVRENADARYPQHMRPNGSHLVIERDRLGCHLVLLVLSCQLRVLLHFSLPKTLHPSHAQKAP